MAKLNLSILKNKLLILILSGNNNTERRTVQQKTWLQDLGDIPHLFLLSGPNTIKDGHYLYVTSPDQNLPLKLYLGYHYCYKDYDYIFTCDDDTYVVVDRLLDSGFEDHDYMGTSYTFIKGDRIGRTHAEGGAGFFLSRHALQKMIPLADYLWNPIASDTMVGDLAAAAKIPLHHHSEFNQGWTMEKRPGELPHPNNTVITSHYMNDEQFMETYKLFHPANMFLV